MTTTDTFVIYRKTIAGREFLIIRSYSYRNGRGNTVRKIAGKRVSIADFRRELLCAERGEL